MSDTCACKWALFLALGAEEVLEVKLPIIDLISLNSAAVYLIKEPAETTAEERNNARAESTSDDYCSTGLVVVVGFFFFCMLPFLFYRFALRSCS